MNLTHMWKAVDGRKSQKPKYWLRLPHTHRFLESLAKKLNTGLSRLLKTTRGRYGGTYAHWQIALAYAKYLSPEFHIWCNDVVKDRFELMAEPGEWAKKKVEIALGSIIRLVAIALPKITHRAAPGAAYYLLVNELSEITSFFADFSCRTRGVLGVVVWLYALKM